MDRKAFEAHRAMAETAHQLLVDRLNQRIADLRKQLDDAHAQLFGNNLWLFVIGLACGVVATVLATSKFGGAS